MKKVLLLTTLLLVVFSGINQAQSSRKAKEKERKEAEKKKRAERKALDALQDSISYAQAVQAMRDGSFVMEANRFQTKRGTMVNVNSITNFVSLNNGTATVQIAFAGAMISPNGVGGITVQGEATNIQMTTTKKNGINYSMNVTGPTMSAQVFITLMPGGGNYATVTISPNFNSNTLMMYGVLVPYSQSRIFQGRSL